MEIHEAMLPLLVCPVCKHRLEKLNSTYRCSDNKCRAVFPIVGGKPVLLNEKRSIFQIKDYIGVRTELAPDKRSVYKFIERVIPSITHNYVAARNYAKLEKLLRQQSASPVVLVVGGGELGVGLEKLLDTQTIKIIETDVYFGPRTHLIADAHDLPFLDRSFDAVVIQAVLEHVLDPIRCVSEIYRVLKPEGIVYAESPFMYPVHLGAYDFMRFSLGAHRRLFRDFAELEGGVAGGPGQALALSIRSFVLSFSRSFLFKVFAAVVLPFLIFWIKYCDYFLIRKPYAEDFASTVYFLGRKAQESIKDEEIINQHWSKRNINRLHRPTASKVPL